MFTAPFQLPLQQGTELFPTTIQAPPIVRTEFSTDVSAPTESLSQLTDLAVYLTQEMEPPVARPSIPPKMGSNDAPVPATLPSGSAMSRQIAFLPDATWADNRWNIPDIPGVPEMGTPPFTPSALVNLQLASMVIDAAVAVGTATQDFLENTAPTLAAEQVAKLAPDVSHFILSQRQNYLAGVAPNQRTYLSLPGLEAEYSALQGTETIRLQVTVPSPTSAPQKPEAVPLEIPLHVTSQEPPPPPEIPPVEGLPAIQFDERKANLLIIAYYYQLATGTYYKPVYDNGESHEASGFEVIALEPYTSLDADVDFKSRTGIISPPIFGSTYHLDYDPVTSDQTVTYVPTQYIGDGLNAPPSGTRYLYSSLYPYVGYLEGGALGDMANAPWFPIHDPEWRYQTAIIAVDRIRDDFKVGKIEIDLRAFWLDNTAGNIIITANYFQVPAKNVDDYFAGFNSVLSSDAVKYGLRRTQLLTRSASAPVLPTLLYYSGPGDGDSDFDDTPSLLYTAYPYPYSLQDRIGDPIGRLIYSTIARRGIWRPG